MSMMILSQRGSGTWTAVGREADVEDDREPVGACSAVCACGGGEVQSVVKALAIPRLGALQRFGE